MLNQKETNSLFIGFTVNKSGSFLAVLLSNLGERINGKSALNILTSPLLVSLSHAWMAKMTIAFKEM